MAVAYPVESQCFPFSEIHRRRLFILLLLPPGVKRQSSLPLAVYIHVSLDLSRETSYEKESLSRSLFFACCTKKPRGGDYRRDYKPPVRELLWNRQGTRKKRYFLSVFFVFFFFLFSRIFSSLSSLLDRVDTSSQRWRTLAFRRARSSTHALCTP